MGLPQFLASCFWSYNLNSLDKEKDKHLIITQILNYGNKEQTDWLLKNYQDNEIKKVIAHPQRGIWLRETLRKRLNYFNLIIDPLDFELAIFDLRPRMELAEAFFIRQEKRKNCK